MFFCVGWVQWSGFLALAPLPASSPSGSEGRDSASGDVALAETAPRPARLAPQTSLALEGLAAEPSVASAKSTSFLEPSLTRTSANELAAEGRMDSPQARPGAGPRPDASPPASEPDGARDKLRSELTLGGSVLDRDGNGVPGLPIQALPRRLFVALDDSPGTAPMLEQRATTDAAGHFSFDQLLDGEYELRIDETELYEKATAVVRAGVDSAVLVVATKSERVLSVHGVVESTRGGPLKGVRVEVAGQPSGSRSPTARAPMASGCPSARDSRTRPCASCVMDTASSGCRWASTKLGRRTMSSATSASSRWACWPR
jgi:protocatechuate 3,4-dioxygenase beta subunit